MDPIVWPTGAEPEGAVNAAGEDQRLIQQLPSTPYRQCTHVAIGDEGRPYLQRWREGRFAEKIEEQGFIASNCAHNARVLVNGQPLCRRHAGMVLLAMCEEMGI